MPQKNRPALLPLLGALRQASPERKEAELNPPKETVWAYVLDQAGYMRTQVQVRARCSLS